MIAKDVFGKQLNGQSHGELLHEQVSLPATSMGMKRITMSRGEFDSKISLATQTKFFTELTKVAETEQVHVQVRGGGERRSYPCECAVHAGVCRAAYI
jgi:hypothetical protein